jgi:uncharacterized iron-regulated membrane protein
MSAARTFRKVHYWTSVALLVTTFVIAITGSLLAVKKDLAVIQPPTLDGSAQGLPERSMASIVPLVNAVPGYASVGWRDIDRIDIRPSDGIAKVILKNRAELQVDIFSGRTIATGYRTSDLIESIHDFSFLGNWAKYVFSLGSGIALLVMGVTGVYLFALPCFARRNKRVKRRADP